MFGEPHAGNESVKSRGNNENSNDSLLPLPNHLLVYLRHSCLVIPSSHIKRDPSFPSNLNPPSNLQSSTRPFFLLLLSLQRQSTSANHPLHAVRTADTSPLLPLLLLPLLLQTISAFVPPATVPLLPPPPPSRSIFQPP